MFQALFRKKAAKADPQGLYGEVVTRARSVPFFTKFGVPDTFDGRFELMVMHIYLLISRLNADGTSNREASQHLFDLFLDDMSAGLREAGVGDTIVPKRLKKMSRVFYGRAAAWDEAMASENRQNELATVLARNLYDLDNPDENSYQLSAYMLAEHESLSTKETGSLMSGGPLFSTPL